MRTIFLILLIFLFLIGSTYSQTSTLAYRLNGSCIERQCEVCDKRIIEWVKESFSSGYGYSFSSGGWCQGNLTEQLSFSSSHYLCQECYLKYNEVYREFLIQIEKDWFESVIKENLNKRAVNRDKNKSDVLKKLLNQIKEIEDKIKELDKK